MDDHQIITIGHSPDGDDAFMFYQIHRHPRFEVDGVDFRIRFFTEDISTLNLWGKKGRLDITALSAHAYAHLFAEYQLLAHGGSFGEGYGPVLMCREPGAREDWFSHPVAAPGEWTTASLALRLFSPRPLNLVHFPFRQIGEEVASGRFRSGLLIHEGQLTYANEGFLKIVDLGEWWTEAEGLPLPLGVNAIYRGIPVPIKRVLNRLLSEGIKVSLKNPTEALAFARGFNPGLSPELMERFVRMYVNEATVEAGERGARAISTLFSRGHAKGLLKKKIPVDFFRD